MSRLLRAGFLHMKKSKAFQVCFFFMIFLGIASPLASYIDKVKNGYGSELNNVFFYYCAYIGIALSVFCSLFIGTEYSDGTIRNKIVVGHSRFRIYLASLIVCSAGAVVLCLAYVIPVLCIGIPLLGFFTLPLPAVAIFFLVSILMALAFVSLFTLVAMLCPSKALTSVVCILGAVFFLLAGTYIYGRLDAPETYTDYALSTNGEMIEGEEVLNPDYLRGTKRKVYEFLLDFLPGGQQIQLAAVLVLQPLVLSLYSLCIIVTASGCGIFVFQRKDIK